MVQMAAAGQALPYGQTVRHRGKTHVSITKYEDEDENENGYDPLDCAAFSRP